MYPEETLPPSLQSLGIEPLSDECTADYFHEITRRKKAPIKNFLLNQKHITGIGNIYACEALFMSKIHPQLPAEQLSKQQCRDVIEHVKEVLYASLELNGTSVSDFKKVDDKSGEFQNFLKVYAQKTCQCGSEILRIKQAGRSTFYCPHCQKI